MKWSGPGQGARSHTNTVRFRSKLNDLARSVPAWMECVFCSLSDDEKCSEDLNPHNVIVLIAFQSWAK